MAKRSEIRCVNHQLRSATHKVLSDGQLVNVCETCKDEIVKRTRLYCKYCSIPVISKDDPSPVLLVQPHKLHCPRSKWGAQ